MTDGCLAAGRGWREKIHLRHREAVVYSDINYQIMQARVADLHRQAQQDAIARAARQGRRPPKRQSGRRVLRLPVITARRVLTAWAAHA
ncbi:MAG TPA: hypothetical protein VG013_28325 [Gemmataceae bacterium]|nr:hypothetical protein [Gemmataceae bacterium]